MSDKGLRSIFHLPWMKRGAGVGNWQAGVLPGLHAVSTKHQLILILKNNKNKKKNCPVASLDVKPVYY